MVAESHFLSVLRSLSFSAALTVSLVFLSGATHASAGATAKLDSPDSHAGYIALLLINETPFPGEHMWISEADTKMAMLQILYVLDSRVNNIPPGYRRKHLADTDSADIIDIMTAGGERGQVDGFYRDSHGRPRTVPRVKERIDYLLRIANKGKPGKFARLLNHAQGLSRAYKQGGIEQADRFAGISRIGKTPVTGRAYSWMTDKNYYAPGGNFIRIPDSLRGGLGGNRFFTLRKLK
jgi:hypothetical protein